MLLTRVSDPEAAAIRSADVIARLVGEAQGQRGVAHLVLAGGTTPNMNGSMLTKRGAVSSWIQLYSESAQESLDTVIQAFRIAERVLLPVMINHDAFYVSHALEAVMRLQMREAHLDPLPLITRAEEDLRAHQPARHVTSVLMNVARDFAGGRFRAASHLEPAYIAIAFARPIRTTARHS